MQQLTKKRVKTVWRAGEILPTMTKCRINRCRVLSIMCSSYVWFMGASRFEGSSPLAAHSKVTKNLLWLRKNTSWPWQLCGLKSAHFQPFFLIWKIVRFSSCNVSPLFAENGDLSMQIGSENISTRRRMLVFGRPEKMEIHREQKKNFHFVIFTRFTHNSDRYFSHSILMRDNDTTAFNWSDD